MKTLFEESDACDSLNEFLLSLFQVMNYHVVPNVTIQALPMIGIKPDVNVSVSLFMRMQYVLRYPEYLVTHVYDEAILRSIYAEYGVASP